MTKALYRYAYNHLVSLSKFDRSIPRVVDRTMFLLNKENTRSLLPVLVGIDVKYNGNENALPIIRGFLNQLIKLRDKHFIRFMTDTMWAMECNNGHIFYTHDGEKESRCDAIWTVGVVGDNQVEIAVHCPTNIERDCLLKELSTEMKKFIPTAKPDKESDILTSTCINFYRNSPRLYQTRYMENPFHVMLIPTTSRRGYYPIPLLGMTALDAKRRYRDIISQIDYQRYTYYEYFKGEFSNVDIVRTLISQIQDTQVFDKNLDFASEAYGLAELLFGMWVNHNGDTKSKRELVLFDAAPGPYSSVQVVRFDMDSLA